MGPERWVDVAASAAVPPGGVHEVAIGDLDLVVWRSSDGRPCAMEARCPHQWSHLAAEGVVDGDEIVCAAHFWRFDRSGRGTKLNVRGRRDVKADIAVHPCREVDGRLEVAVTPAEVGGDPELAPD